MDGREALTRHRDRMCRPHALHPGAIAAVAVVAGLLGCSDASTTSHRSSACADAERAYETEFAALAQVVGTTRKGRSGATVSMPIPRLEVASVAALSAVETLPNVGLQGFCYDDILRRQGFSGYPPYADMRALRQGPEPRQP